MGSAKTKQHQPHSKPEHPTYTQEFPQIPYYQPIASPYELPIITITIGKKDFSIPSHVIRNHPQFDRHLLWSTTIDFSDAHEDAGHTLMHFLHSGSYETPFYPRDEAESKAAREFRIAVLTYQASGKYKLRDLRALAKHYIEFFGEVMTTPEILQITREILSKLPEDETWLPNYIKLRMERFLVRGESASDLDVLYTALGQDSFVKFVTRMMLDILSDRLFSREAKTCHGQTSKDISAKEPFVVQSEGSQSEELPTDYHPEPEQAAGAVDDYPEPEQAAGAVDDYFEPEQAAGAVGYLEPAEYPVLGKSNSKLRLTKNLLENVYLYEDWEILSPKKRETRTKALKARNLPIPDKDGVIATLVI